MGLGCAPRFDQMSRELDQLRLPSDYVLIDEKISGSKMGFFGEYPEVQRLYRAPREIDPICIEVEEAVRAFAKPTRDFSKRQVNGRTVCSISFRRRSFNGGAVATGRPTAEMIDRFKLEGEFFVQIVVRLYD